MSVTQTITTTNGCCPACGWPAEQRDLAEAHGHLSDGLLWFECRNCREQVHVTFEFAVTQGVS